MPILVWEIQKKDEASLDLYEGYPNFYDKQMLEIELDGKIDVYKRQGALRSVYGPGTHSKGDESRG